MMLPRANQDLFFRWKMKRFTIFTGYMVLKKPRLLSPPLKVYSLSYVFALEPHFYIYYGRSHCLGRHPLSARGCCALS